MVVKGEGSDVTPYKFCKSSLFVWTWSGSILDAEPNILVIFIQARWSRTIWVRENSYEYRWRRSFSCSNSQFTSETHYRVRHPVEEDQTLITFTPGTYAKLSLSVRSDIVPPSKTRIAHQNADPTVRLRHLAPIVVLVLNAAKYFDFRYWRLP